VFTQFVVDKVIVDRDVGLLTVMLPAMVAALVFLLLANLIQQYLLSFVAVRIDSAVLDFLTRRLLALPMSYFQSGAPATSSDVWTARGRCASSWCNRAWTGLLACVQLIGCVALMAAVFAETGRRCFCSCARCMPR
jgi:ABC-type bacteriocin/lantibiotic exporter with double-glycine peptidase domain